MSSTQNTHPAKYDLDSDTLNSLYDWVDSVPLSRPKRNIARDFSDAGVYYPVFLLLFLKFHLLLKFSPLHIIKIAMAAEVVWHFFPKFVEKHNYPDANAVSKKVDNWRTFNSLHHDLITHSIL